jgi:hypothetical protein
MQTEARPTADLGEDGELVEKLLAWRDDRREVDDVTGAGQHPNTELLTQAIDRLILYREALRRARRVIATETFQPDELAAIDDVLSRSGDQPRSASS